MLYSASIHCFVYHRHHTVRQTQYRYKVLQADIQPIVWEICRQLCREKEVDTIWGMLSAKRVHRFLLVPPKLAVSDLVRLMKGRTSHKVQREFP